MKVFHGPKGVSNRLKNDRNRKLKNGKGLKDFSLKQSLTKKDKDNRNSSYTKRIFELDDPGVFRRVNTADLLNRREIEKSYIDQLNFNARKAKFDGLLKKYRENRNLAIEMAESTMAKDFDLRHMVYINNYQLIDNIKAGNSGQMVNYYV